MKIDYLGHSEMLINIENSNWENVKILSDTWLSDWSVADLMQRNPIVNIDYDKLENIDAVFISHSHMDHLDSYSLIDIFSKLKNKPILLLPETLEDFSDLLKNELDCEIKILKNKETIQIKWINIQWVIFPDYMNTNEADVMTLCIWNDEEIMFTEIDIVPPDTEEWIAYIYQLFTQKDFKTRLYISTRNELEGNLTIIDLKPSQREEFAQEYKERRVGEMYNHYNNIFALEEEWVSANIYALPWFAKAFIGQGIIFPAKEFGCEGLKLQIMSLEENAELEKSISEDFGFNFPTYALNQIEKNEKTCAHNWLGRYVFTNWELKKVEKIPYLTWTYYKTEQDLKTYYTRELKNAPILKEKIDMEQWLNLVQDYLNNKFLPYQLWRIDANLKNLALETNGEYIIKINSYDFENEKIINRWYFKFTLWHPIFVYEKQEPTNYNETYFIEDLYNFIQWNVELYSNFWQYLEPWTNIYLWECLWADFLNNNILHNKFLIHFKLAKEWVSPEKFVLDIIK